MAKVTTNINLDEDLKKKSKGIVCKSWTRYDDGNYDVLKAEHKGKRVPV